MQLKVSYPMIDEHGDAGVRERIIVSFRDIVSVGADLARCARIWLRGVPLAPHESRLYLQVHAAWEEGTSASANPGPAQEASAPKRKRKAKK